MDQTLKTLFYINMFFHTILNNDIMYIRIIVMNLHYMKLHYNSLITNYWIVIINVCKEYIYEDFHSSDNKIRYIIRHISADWGINFVEYEDDIRPLWAIKDAVDFLYHS